MKATAVLFSLLAITPSCIAQQAGKAPPKEPFVVEAGDVQLGNLIDRCAAYLDCNILVSPQEMAQSGAAQVRLQKAVTTDRDGCQEFLANVLSRSGFALTNLDGKGTTLEVISVQGPRAREISTRAMHATVEDVMKRPDLKIWVLTTMPLQHINATIATNALRPFFASSGGPSASLTLGNVGNNTSMLLLGPQDQVASAIRLLRTCDVPPPKEEVARGEMLAQRLEQLEARMKAIEEKLAALTKK